MHVAVMHDHDPGSLGSSHLKQEILFLACAMLAMVIIVI